jgi:pimeloyl-ACP methyl ester carboxylesterase
VGVLSFGAVATFVLVPGGCLGGWAWQRVARHLRTAGHEVYPVTLTGLGDRAHLTPLGFDGHVVDVVALLVAEDLHDVVLVGHSYGGTVASAVAYRSPERLAHLAYVDAIVPTDGQSNADAVNEIGGAAMLEGFASEAARRRDGRFGSEPEVWGAAGRRSRVGARSCG